MKPKLFLQDETLMFTKYYSKKFKKRRKFRFLRAQIRNLSRKIVVLSAFPGITHIPVNTPPKMENFQWRLLGKWGWSEN